MSGFVYIFTHSKMPGLIKIGKAKNVEVRMKQLSKPSGVPGPFEEYYSKNVKDVHAVERRLQNKLKKNRIEGTEFFEFEPENAKIMLMSPAIFNATSTKKPNGRNLKNSGEAETNGKSKDPRQSAFTFSSVKIPINSELHFKKDPKIVVKVINDNQIEYKGKAYSLSGLAKILLKKTYDVQGPNYWLYDGQVLTKIKNKARQKRSPSRAFTFSSVNIPINSRLRFRKNPKIIVKVIDDNRIEYKGETYSLSGLARILLKKPYDVQGPAYWTYRGQTLSKMRS